MKKEMLTFTVFTLILFSITPIHAMASASASTIVYIMPHGEKYHSKECYHLSDGYSAVTLETAYRKGYEQCKSCDAPLLNYSDRAKIARETNNKKTAVENAPLKNVASTGKADIYHKMQPKTIILLGLFSCFLLSLLIYISKLKKTIRKKEQELTELKTDLKISQTKIDMMNEFQSQSNHPKEENS